MSVLIPELPVDLLDAFSFQHTPLRVYAVGLQKCGSTLMTHVLANAFNVSVQDEAARNCCCERVPHSCDRADASSSGFQAAECVDASQLVAPLFNNDPDRYMSQCSVQLEASIVKADDMLWQVHSLMERMAQPLPPALRHLAGTQFIFYVRHPLFNVRSQLAWCAPLLEGCAPALSDLVRDGSNNTLYLRVFADRATGAVTADPVRLAANWKAGTRAREPSNAPNPAYTLFECLHALRLFTRSSPVDTLLGSHRPRCQHVCMWMRSRGRVLARPTALRDGPPLRGLAP